MAGFSPRNNRCRNRRNHNCSPCSSCGRVEHDLDCYGERCLNCNREMSGLGEWEDYEEPSGGGRRINRKRRFDDEED